MSDKNRAPNFAIGVAGKREVKRLLKRSNNPAATIANFQQTRSLHSMFAKSFGTVPHYAAEEDKEADKETLDTDSVLKFLGHLGVSHHEVHKRIAGSLQKQLEAEIRKIGPNDQEALLNLLKNCWHHATTVPELRPILWAVLKQLGEQTPLAVLTALGERESPGSQKLKHVEIFRPLPNLLKRLVWEADWDDKIPVSKEISVNNPKDYLKLVQATLLHETLQPIVESYCSTEALLLSAGKFFVASAHERRVLTTQRRALAQSTTTTTSSTTVAGSTSTSALMGKTAGTSKDNSSSSDALQNSGMAISQLRQFLGDTASGTASYRPKLLRAVLSMLMAHHGAQAPKVLTATHLHCTLVADILLSAGGPLPKVYSHLHTLARVLDDAVRNGVLSDKDLLQVQSTLQKIYDEEQSEDDGEKEEASKKKAEAAVESEEKNDAKKSPSTFLQRQLNRIITAGLQAMKESDPQNLFLNPVTDSIAPGYSKVIKKPMSISNMESKIENNVYNSIDEWNADVRLMFKNCQDYNRGQAGQWFRGEASRQLKVFREEILPEAKKLFAVEQKKRNPEEELKRKREEAPKEPEVSPLPAATKKRKVSETAEYTLSMPALASMLLADPYVVRLLLDRVLRSLRVDVLRGSTIPAANKLIPSFLQLLHMARWSTQMCAIRGRKYLVPDPGIDVPAEGETLENMIPFDSLRKYLPVVGRLLLESELDRRVATGGDLNDVADALPREDPPTIELSPSSPPYQVAVAVLEGAFVHICLPGNSLEASLSVTFTKFAKALQELVGHVWEEETFFISLVPTILRHKARLNRTVRDTIISTWMSWFVPSDETASTKKKKKGAMTSPGHEHFVNLLNEWAAFGNLLLPRDLLLQVSTDLVKQVDATENSSDRKFTTFWNNKESKEFEPIRAQYERMLNHLPETHVNKWKSSVGLADAAMETEA
eukprot:Nitzschia sp. Nitz4//scaffold2_size372955//231176//233998//NITZ4_000442-RA/size372955-processed-gene-0.434-mRNA-1//1//CDS//3329546835//2404//frame0